MKDVFKDDLLSGIKIIGIVLAIILPFVINSNIIRQKEIELEKYKIEINELERKLETIEAPEVRLEKAKQSIKKILDFDYNGVNDQIIEEIVEKVIVHKDYFEWKLNFMTDTIKLQIIGKNKANCYVSDYEKN